MRTSRAPLVPVVGCLLLAACSRGSVGTAERPFTMYFVPSVDRETIEVSADQLTTFVERHVSRSLLGEEQGFHVQSVIPASYSAVIDAFGSGRADFAALNTSSYILARDHEGHDVVPIVTVVRGDGETTYRGQILARADSGLETVSDLTGRSFAYGDPASTAGYVLPASLLAENGVQLGETTFAMTHDNVVTMVYEGTVDAGATYYSPPVVETVEGQRVETVRDARTRVLERFPDVLEQVKIIGLTAETPNAPWVIRGDVYEDPGRQAELQAAVRDALLDFANTDAGREALDRLYNVSGLAAVDESVYDSIRELVLASGVDLVDASR